MTSTTFPASARAVAVPQFDRPVAGPGDPDDDETPIGDPVDDDDLDDDEEEDDDEDDTLWAGCAACIQRAMSPATMR